MSEKEDGLNEINSMLRKMIDREVDPYQAGWFVWGKAFSSLKISPDTFGPLWLIWGALTDWVEVKPDEVEIAKSKMLQAAEEWLQLSTEITKLEYINRWVKELGIVGYHTKNKNNEKG
jgi:hypothetical protein